MSRKFFSGTTLEQAVLAAARHYAIDPERVAYTTRDKRHGFVNVRKKFVIEVDPNAPLRAKGDEVPWEPKLAGRPAKAEPRSSAAPASPAPKNRGRAPESQSRRPNSDRRAPEPAVSNRPKVDIEPVTDDPLDAADLALGDLADLLLFDMEWEISGNDDQSLEIDLGGDDSHQIVAEDGRILRSDRTPRSADDPWQVGSEASSAASIARVSRQITRRTCAISRSKSPRKCAKANIRAFSSQ